VGSSHLERFFQAPAGNATTPKYVQMALWSAQMLQAPFTVWRPKYKALMPAMAGRFGILKAKGIWFQ
jgi:hypothetical protein